MENGSDHGRLSMITVQSAIQAEFAPTILENHRKWLINSERERWKL